MDIRGPSKSVTFTTPTGDITSEFGIILSIKKWFTNVNSVKILFGSIARNQKIRCEEQILSGTEENYLNYSGIKIGSERIKSLKIKTNPDVLAINDYDWYEFSENDIKVGSVKVFSLDESKILTEGIDYQIDYIAGKIRLIYPKATKSESISVFTGEGEFLTEFAANISVQKNIKIHCEFYKNHVIDLDYSINYNKGKIARLIGGDIKSGSKVYCDYEVHSTVETELIEEAIDIAHTEILDLIGTEYRGSSDIRLKYAESNIAMQYLLDSATIQTIQKLHSAESSRQLSKLGDKYADRFRERGLQMLKSFTKKPMFATGGKKQKNYSW